MKKHSYVTPPVREPLIRAGLVVLAAATALLSFGCGVGSERSASADKTTPEAPVAEAAPNVQPAPVPPPVMIPSGTTITVRLLETISSRTARSGQQFAAELAAPVVVHGSVIFPKNSRVNGHVVAARESGRLHDPGYLRLTLDAAQIPDGNWINLRTTSVSAEARSQKKRNWTMIGGGAGLGAIIGGLAGGGKGAAIGAASGAGAGTAAAYSTGKRDVTFPVERKLRFATVEEVVMNR